MINIPVFGDSSVNSVKNLKLVVIVPAYNEEESIGATVCAIRKQLDAFALQNISGFIFVVDDGSIDKTYQFAMSAGVDRVIRHRTNRGLGAAVRSGLLAARDEQADVVVKFDADLQHDPGDIENLIGPILSGIADVVYGNRFEHISYRMPFLRRIGNFLFTKLMSLLTGWSISDAQPGLFAVNRDYLDRFWFPGDYNYTQQILLDAFHNKMKFAQVDVKFSRRETGKSFVSLKYPWKVLSQIFWIIVCVKPMKIFGTVGLAFLFVSTIVMVSEIGRWLWGAGVKPVVHVNFVIGALIMGLQSLSFGVLAELIIQTGNRKKQ